MIKVVLLLICSIVFILIVSKIGQFLIKKIEHIENKEDQSNLEQIEIKKEAHEYKEVLKKENCSSSKKPFQDYNDKQNLTKFNHGTYRDERGRFKSNKQWKKEQETS